MLARRGVEHCRQLRMNRNQKLNTGLALFHVEGWPFRCLADVLPPHADDIGTPLRAVEQERERETRLRPDGIVRLKLGNLVLAPRVESVALDGCELDVCGRVGAQVAALDPKLTEGAQGRAPTARRMRRLAVE